MKSSPESARIRTKDIQAEGSVLAAAVAKNSSISMGDIRAGQNVALVAALHEIPIAEKNLPTVLMIADHNSNIRVNNIIINSESKLPRQQLGVVIKGILLKIVETQLASQERKEMACYLEPERDGELLKTKILNEFKSGNDFKVEATSVLLTGDVGMGKTMFLLRLAQELLTSESDFLPVYVSLVDAFERGFLSKKNYCDIIAEMCCANKDRTMDLSPQDIITYLNHTNIIHIIDSCDEIPVEHLRAIYSECLIGDLGYESGSIRHMLFACRSEVLYRHPTEFFNWFSAANSPAHFKQFELQSISHSQCLLYLEKFVDRVYESQSIADRSRMLDRYKYWLRELPGLEELVRTPLLLQLVAEVLPEIANNIDTQRDKKSIEITRPIIYAQFFLRWIEREEAKFRSIQRLPDELIYLNPPRLSCYVALYSINLAIELWEKHGYEFKIQAGTLDDSITLRAELLKPSERAKAIFSNIVNKATLHENTRLKWLNRYEEMERFYSGETLELEHQSDAKILSGEMKYVPDNSLHWEYNNEEANRLALSKARVRLFRAHSLLKVCDNEYVKGYKFLHKSIIEFLTGLSILSDLSYLEHAIAKASPLSEILSAHALINEKPMREDRQLIRVIAEQFTRGEESCNLFLSKLFKVVIATRRYSGLNIAASNALTIIVAIDPLYLIRKNLSDVEISYADISNAFCCETIFGNTDMSRVWAYNTDFYGAVFKRTNFSAAGYDGLEFGNEHQFNLGDIKALEKIYSSWLAINGDGVVYKLKGDLSCVLKSWGTGHTKFSKCLITTDGYFLFLTKNRSKYFVSSYKIRSIDNDTYALAEGLSTCFKNIEINCSDVDVFSVGGPGSYLVVAGLIDEYISVQIIDTNDISNNRIFRIVPKRIFEGMSFKFTEILFQYCGSYLCIATSLNMLISVDLSHPKLSEANLKIIEFELISTEMNIWKAISYTIEELKIEMHNAKYPWRVVEYLGSVDAEAYKKHIENLTDKQTFTCEKPKLLFLSDDGILTVLFFINTLTYSTAKENPASKSYINFCEIDISISGYIFSPTRYDSSLLPKFIDNIESAHYDRYNGKNRGRMLILYKVTASKMFIVEAYDVMCNLVCSEYLFAQELLSVQLYESEGDFYRLVIENESSIELAKFNNKANCIEYQLPHFQNVSAIEIADKMYIARVNRKEIIVTVFTKSAQGEYFVQQELTLTLPNTYSNTHEISRKVASHDNLSKPEVLLKILKSARMIVVGVVYFNNLDLYNVMALPLTCIDAKLILLDDNAFTAEQVKCDLMILCRHGNDHYELYYYINELNSIKFDGNDFGELLDDVNSIPSGNSCNNKLLISILLEKIGKCYHNDIVKGLMSQRLEPLPTTTHLTSKQEVCLITKRHEYGSISVDSISLYVHGKKSDLDTHTTNKIRSLRDSRSEIICCDVVYDKGLSSLILLYEESKNETSQYKLFYNDCTIRVPDFRMSDAMSVSEVNHVGEFYVVLNSQKLLVFKFGRKLNKYEVMFKSKVRYSNSICLPSIWLECVFIVTDDTHLSALQFRGNEQTADTSLYVMTNKIVDMQLCGIQDSSLILITSSSVYLFSVEKLSDTINLCLRWFSGKHSFNTHNATFHNVFGMTSKQREALSSCTVKAPRPDVVPFKPMNQLFFKPPTTPPIRQMTSCFEWIEPCVQFVSNEAVVTFCRKKGRFLFSDRPVFIVVECIEQGSYVVIAAEKINTGWIIDQKLTNEFREKFRIDFVLTQYKVKIDSAVNAIFQLRSVLNSIEDDMIESQVRSNSFI